MEQAKPVVHASPAVAYETAAVPDLGSSPSVDVAVSGNCEEAVALSGSSGGAVPQAATRARVSVRARVAAPHEGQSRSARGAAR